MISSDFATKISSSYQKEKKNIKNEIVRYIDRYSNILYSAKFTENIFFSDDDRSVLYEAMRITENDMEDAISKSKYINRDFKVSSNPFYIISMLVIREALMKKDKDNAMLLSVYMSFMMYSSMHSNFLQYKGNEDIMDYTINNLDNNFKFKKLGTIFKLLEDNVETWMATYQKRILNGSDDDFVYVINALQTRIKGKLRKIFNEFYKNWENGNYLLKDSIYTGEDEFKNADNNSFIVQRLTDKVYLNLVQKGVNDKLIKYSITKSDIAFEKLKSIVVDLVRGDTKNELQEILAALIEYYIMYSGNDASYISKGDFIVFMKKAYASNTEASQIRDSKEIIEKWINDNSTKYGMKRYGKTAMQSYKKAVFMFMVYTINTNSKN